MQAIRVWLRTDARMEQDLDRLARSLSEITHRTEPEFVNLTGVLKGLYTSAVELSRETRTRVSAVEQALAGVGDGGCRELASHAVVELNARLNENADNLSSLRGIADSLHKLHRKGQDLERLATVIEVSRYVLAVEGGRTAERREAFLEFIDELHRLGKQIQVLGVQIVAEAGAVQDELNRLVTTISSGLAELRQFTERSTAAAHEASEEVQHLLRSAFGVLSEAEGHTRAITGYAEDAGYYLQFGDIVRQKLEHVHSALTDAMELRGDAGQRAAVAQILAVQSAQLAQVKAEITAASSKLHATFAGLAQKTDCLAQGMQALSVNEQSSGNSRSAFEEVSGRLKELGQLEHDGSALCQQAGRMAGRARAASTEFAKHLEQVQSLNQQMHLQALNAIVKTAHLGDEGGTLGVLSMHVHDLARQSDSIAHDTIGVLRNLEEQPLNLGSAASADQNGQERITRGLEEIHRIDTELRAAAEGSLTLAQRQQERLTEARARLEFLTVLSDSVGRFAEELDALGRRYAAGQSPAAMAGGLDSLAGRYTMASEVEVHRRLLEGATEAPAPEPVAEPVAVAADSSDFGDNIELF